MGWVLIVLGLIQLTGGFSLMAGNTYGRLLTVTPFTDDGDEQSSALAAGRTGMSDDSMQALGATFGDGVDLVRHLLKGARSTARRS